MIATINNLLSVQNKGMSKIHQRLHTSLLRPSPHPRHVWPRGRRTTRAPSITLLLRQSIELLDDTWSPRNDYRGHRENQRWGHAAGVGFSRGAEAPRMRSSRERAAHGGAGCRCAQPNKHRRPCVSCSAAVAALSAAAPSLFGSRQASCARGIGRWWCGLGAARGGGSLARTPPSATASASLDSRDPLLLLLLSFLRLFPLAADRSISSHVYTDA